MGFELHYLLHENPTGNLFFYALKTYIKTSLLFRTCITKKADTNMPLQNVQIRMASSPGHKHEIYVC
jgi:hypothetical protein